MLKIGSQTAGWYNVNDPDGSFAFIKSCGFDAVDFNIDGFIPVNDMAKKQEHGPYQSFFDKSVEELIAYFTPMKAAAEKHGITFCQMHGPDKLWFPDRDELNEYLIGVFEKCFAVAQFLSCPAVVVHPVQRPTKKEEWEVNMAAYKRLIPAAKQYGVKVCLENLFVHRGMMPLEAPCADGAEACLYVDTLNEAAGEEVFGFCFDVGHANLLHKNLSHYIETLGHRLTCLHIHDNDGQNDLHMAPYTQTRYYKTCTCALDWELFIQGLRRINYRGSMCFETFRVTNLTPKPLWDSVLTHIINIGKYFRDRILAEEE